VLLGLAANALALRAADTPKAGDGAKPADGGKAADDGNAGDNAKAAESSTPTKAAKAEGTNADHELIQQLLVQIEALQNRVAELEARDHGAATSEDAAATPATAHGAAPSGLSAPPTASSLGPTLGTTQPAAPLGVAPGAPTVPVAPAAAAPPPLPAAASTTEEAQEGGHNMSLPGGPKLNIRGFLDFNADLGTAANPLIYPLTVPPPTTIHNTFQFGEFDLFLSSRLSDTVSFLSEVVFGADASNFWGIDIERAQISYKPNPYFQISAGRMHTAIGYYNTTYHHGTWFQTATGRPYMYFYEDSGGILPVHIVGVEVQGLIPHTGSWNAHWIAEIGNGTSSAFIGQPIVAEPVQNFVSDTDHKAFNIAGYIKPEWLSGLQIGGNYYNDERVPAGNPHVNNIITGAYVVYATPVWEFFNECEVQQDHSVGSAITYKSPLCYTQFSHKFGKYRPYFRWQEVNVPVNDPLYGTVGRFEGPSFGTRFDLTEFAALKLQYNRIYTRNPLAKNGVDGQVSFTF
jgi:hypothetical protein